MLSKPIPVQVVRVIPPLQSLQWIQRGWSDMLHAGWLSITQGVILAALGVAIMLIAHHRFWLLASAMSGFLVIAPVLATSLYTLSQTIDRGDKPSLQIVLKTWLNWQNSHFSKWGNDYWCMFQFGTLLALAATGWVLTSAALITLLAPAPILTPLDFLRHVVLAQNGWLFELWLVLGGILAAPVFASSVIAMPLLLERRVTLMQAVLISWTTVLTNPIPMAIWAALILGLTSLGMATFMLGLIVIIPVLGHASWHAYCDLVDSSELERRSEILKSDSAQGPR